MEPEVTIDGVRLCEVALSQAESHLSRRLTEHLPGGEVRVRSLVIVSKEGDGGAIRVTPFAGERASTLYHDRPLHLYRTGSTPRLYEEL